MVTLVHVTHEAREKMGGIGAVLEGLLTSRAYQQTVGRTLLLGCGCVPLSEASQTVEHVLYQTGVPPAQADAPGPNLAAAFRTIETTFGIRLLYGYRRIPCPLRLRRSRVELLVLDVRNATPDPVNRLKHDLWEAYGLQSDRYQADWGYEEWVRMAGPALEALKVLVGPDLNRTAVVSHEFMGLPTVLAARLRLPEVKTIYWAHEVPPVRDMMEREAGHRLVFDRALDTEAGAVSYRAHLREAGGYKHALVSRAHEATAVFAVSERVARELAILDGAFRRRRVHVVYNGLPVRPITLDDRLASRNRLIRYAAAVAGLAPDFVFTHVARPVASKAIERDLAVLENLDNHLAERGETAMLFVLASDAGRRDPETVRHMEHAYGWPMHHREGWPDLAGGEVSFGRAAEAYNDQARATRVVLINQFGFDRTACGDRMPADTGFVDLRQGSDVEFGLSTYEPFGIAPLETLAFGGICVLSCACGCATLLRHVAGGNLPPNVLLADYSAPPEAGAGPIGEGETRRIEHEVATRLATALAARLPRSAEDHELLLATGWPLAERISWQAVCRDYLLPALAQCFGTRPPGIGRRIDIERALSPQACPASGKRIESR